MYVSTYFGFVPWCDHENHDFFWIVVLGCCVIDAAPTLSLSLAGSATTTAATESKTVSSSPSIVDMLGNENDLMVPVCKTNAGINPTDTIYIKTQVFRLLRYYSPAPRNIARSDWVTQNITHNMTSSIIQPYGLHSL